LSAIDAERGGNLSTRDPPLLLASCRRGELGAAAPGAVFEAPVTRGLEIVVDCRA